MCYVYKIVLVRVFTGWEVRIGRNCARGLVYHGTVSPNTDRPRQVNKFFFSYWDLKVSGKFYFGFQTMCVEVGRVRVDEARDRLRNQNNTLQHDFSLVSYIIKIKLSFRIKKRFLVIGRQFIICVSNKEEWTNLILKATGWIFTLRLGQSSGMKTAKRLYKRANYTYQS